MGRSYRAVISELLASERVARVLSEPRRFPHEDAEVFRADLIARFLDPGWPSRSARERPLPPHATHRTALAHLRARAAERAEVVLVIEGTVPALVGTLQPDPPGELQRDWCVVAPDLTWGFFFSHEAQWLPIAHAER